MILNEKKILNDSLDILDDRAMIIAMEELAELQQAVSKGLRDKLNYENLCEEIADTLIVLEWVKAKYNVREEDVENWKQTKLLRMKDRIESNQLN